MTDVIKLKKGLTIKLDGEAENKVLNTSDAGAVQVFGIVPDDFVGVKPKMMVREGDEVKAGDALFVNKQYPNVSFVSPVDGKVTDIVRGDRRKVLCVKVEGGLAVSEAEKSPIALADAESMVAILAEKGLLGYITQMPYAISANDQELPRDIFVSAFRDMPLSADVDFCLQGEEDNFVKGLEVLSKIAPVHVGLSYEKREALSQKLSSLDSQLLTLHYISGKCPAGNVNVQINNIKPINKGEIVWTAEPEVVMFIGRLFNTGKVDFHKKVAICGSEVNDPHYEKVVVGQSVASFLQNVGEGCRIINGNVLTGKKTTDTNAFVGAHSYEVTVIPEGDDNAEMLGWIAPMCLRNRKPADARIKGGRRHMIMSGEYDKVLPMDIFGEYLIKAIICGDIDRMEQLGIYEVAPEDFALAEYVDSSKLELQRIVREGLDMLRKENS